MKEGLTENDMWNTKANGWGGEQEKRGQTIGDVQRWRT